MSKGEFGCAWSHLKIYEKLVKDSEYDSYLVLEDDSEITCDINHFEKVISKRPKLYDIVHIARSDWYPFVLYRRINEYYFKPFKRPFNRTTAYFVSKNGAKKLLEKTQNYINVPADDLLSETFFKGDLDVYCLEKSIVKNREIQSIINKIEN